MMTSDFGGTILLVGGDLCRRVAARLNLGDWTLYGLRRRPVDDSRIRWFAANLGDPASLRGLPAAITHVLYAPSPDARDQASYRMVYPDGLAHLLDALPDTAHIARCVLVDSTAVWPPASVQVAANPQQASPPAPWIDEDTPACPDNFRGAAMLEAEDILHVRLPGRGVALRLGGLYGPGRTRLIEGLRAGRIVAPDGPGHWSNRIHIEDAAAACIHLLGLAAPSRYYIGTDGHPTETAQFYDSLADMLKVARPARRLMPPSGKRLSNARLVASGWQPQWPDALAGYRTLVS